MDKFTQTVNLLKSREVRGNNMGINISSRNSMSPLQNSPGSTLNSTVFQSVIEHTLSKISSEKFDLAAFVERVWEMVPDNSKQDMVDSLQQKIKATVQQPCVLNSTKPVPLQPPLADVVHIASITLSQSSESTDGEQSQSPEPVVPSAFALQSLNTQERSTASTKSMVRPSTVSRNWDSKTGIVLQWGPEEAASSSNFIGRLDQLRNSIFGPRHAQGEDSQNTLDSQKPRNPNIVPSKVHRKPRGKSRFMFRKQRPETAYGKSPEPSEHHTNRQLLPRLNQIVPIPKLISIVALKPDTVMPDPFPVLQPANRVRSKTAMGTRQRDAASMEPAKKVPRLSDGRACNNHLDGCLQKIRVIHKPEVATAHYGAIRWKCSLCPYYSSVRRYMEDHYARHGLVGTLACSSCDFATDSARSFHTHKQYHESEASYSVFYMGS